MCLHEGSTVLVALNSLRALRPPKGFREAKGGGWVAVGGKEGKETEGKVGVVGGNGDGKGEGGNGNGKVGAKGDVGIDLEERGGERAPLRAGASQASG